MCIIFYIYILFSLLNIPMVLIDIQCGLPTMAMVWTASLHARLALKGPRRPRGCASPQTGGRFPSAALGALCPSHTPPPPPRWANGGKQAEEPELQLRASGLRGAWGSPPTHHPPLSPALSQEGQEGAAKPGHAQGRDTQQRPPDHQRL